ncbi:hypothetical protein X798_03944 [Onchocerca flexuosa]|uniref:Uncharacterized protein n=1 Tax=Onchocerca flexuosa TaxID=387005 RepID=A0A238BVK3_9BILA|nr:hypothetical protein X798_03944 [Onchocerca flexuosa]
MVNEQMVQVVTNASKKRTVTLEKFLFDTVHSLPLRLSSQTNSESQPITLELAHLNLGQNELKRCTGPEYSYTDDMSSCSGDIRLDHKTGNLPYTLNVPSLPDSFTAEAFIIGLHWKIISKNTPSCGYRRAGYDWDPSKIGISQFKRSNTDEFF